MIIVALAHRDRRPLTYVGAVKDDARQPYKFDISWLLHQISESATRTKTAGVY